MGGKNTNNGKMRIRMLTPASGTDWNAAALEEVDRPKDEALRFIAGGLAEAVTKAKKPRRETATREARETETTEG